MAHISSTAFRFYQGPHLSLVQIENRFVSLLRNQHQPLALLQDRLVTPLACDVQDSSYGMCMVVHMASHLMGIVVPRLPSRRLLTLASGSSRPLTDIC